MNGFLRACLHRTMYKRIDESMLRDKTIEIPESDIACFCLSSNRILSFPLDGKRYFFRECPPLLDSGEYFQRETALFFQNLNKRQVDGDSFKQAIPIRVTFSQETIDLFREYIEGMKQDMTFLRNLSRGDILSKKLGFSIWEPQVYDRAFFEAFGLKNLPESCMEIGVYYLWCMRGASQGYKLRNIARGKRYGYFSAVKSVASRIVADAMGLGHLVTSAEFCRLVRDDGSSLFGVLSPGAPGFRMADSEPTPCGSLQKELTELHFLDMICMQTDHGPNNYNLDPSDGVCRICAFDNDNPNTFLPLPVIDRRLAGSSALVDGKGLINRPYVSRTLYSGICNLDLPGLNRAVKPYLNSLQRAALIARIKGLRKALRKTSRERSGFILEDGQWNDQTAAQELSGNYGNTYFTNALKRKGNTHECIHE